MTSFVHGRSYGLTVMYGIRQRVRTGCLWLILSHHPCTDALLHVSGKLHKYDSIQQSSDMLHQDTLALLDRTSFPVSAGG